MPQNRSSTYVLQDNSTVGPWLSMYEQYNCYAFVLGETDAFYCPGDFSGGGYRKSQSVSTWAEMTEDDLRARNNACVVVSTSYSEIMELSSSHDIICLRKSSVTNNEGFHYMMYYNGTWRHKPGNTHVLRFHYLPYEVYWLSEYSFGSGDELETGCGTQVYTGTIYYFAFGNTHQYEVEYTGENYHSGGKHYYQYAGYCPCGAYTTYYESIDCDGPPCYDMMNRLIDDPIAIAVQ